MLKVKFFIIFLFFCILINFKLIAADCKKPQMPSDAEWQNWLTEIKKEALNLGISKKILESDYVTAIEDMNFKKLNEMRKECLKLIDGNGTKRIIQNILSM